jgi:DNA-binding transcriptional LysR family regulator
MDLLGALRTFVRTAELGSFSAVGRETGASHSAITRQIADLEAHFGVRLFHRTTRRLSLTDDGEILLAQARDLNERAEALEIALSGHRSSPAGLVRLGTSVTAGMFLARRLPVLLAQHPGLSVELVIRDQPGDMIEERLDLGLRAGEISDSSLVARLIGRYGRLAVAAPEYLEQHGTPDTPLDLPHHACLLHDGVTERDIWHFDGPDGAISVKVSGSFIANNTEAVHAAARAGHGIALLAEMQVRDDIRSGRLRWVLCKYPSLRVPVYLVYPSRRHLPPRTRVVMDFVLEQLKKAPPMADSEFDAAA